MRLKCCDFSELFEVKESSWLTDQQTELTDWNAVNQNGHKMPLYFSDVGHF